VLRALLRTFFRGLLVLVLLLAAGSLYYLYKAGRLPYVQQAVEDAALAASVKAAFALDRDLAARTLRVEAHAGSVTLRGMVRTEEEQSQAVAVARSVEGVLFVEELLDLDPALEPAEETGARSLGETIDDAALSAKVRAALELDRETSDLPLELTVRAGTVVVSGRVPSEEARERAIDRISRVSGVENVLDRTRLER
jgi:osmotically-inducible protein OsmY